MGKKAIPVNKIDLDTGEVIKTYSSISEAAKDNYTQTTSICQAIKGVYSQHIGYKWAKA